MPIFLYSGNFGEPLPANKNQSCIIAYLNQYRGLNPSKDKNKTGTINSYHKELKN